jgi:hypothetical protein
MESRAGRQERRMVFHRVNACDVNYDHSVGRYVEFRS